MILRSTAAILLALIVFVVADLLLAWVIPFLLGDGGLWGYGLVFVFGTGLTAMAAFAPFLIGTLPIRSAEKPYRIIGIPLILCRAYLMYHLYTLEDTPVREVALWLGWVAAIPTVFLTLAGVPED